MADGSAHGLTIERRFTTAGKDPYAGIQWTRRDSKITNPDGSVVFEMKDAEVPATFSQVAADIMVSKYFRKAGVLQLDSYGDPILDEGGDPVTGPEHSAKDVFNRLAETWRWWGENYGYFASGDDAQAFEDELKYMLANQMAAPNSPQWFNTGLAHKYGITGTKQGFWYVDEESGEALESEDAYTRPAPHACFIQAVADDLVNPGGIMDLWVREARLFKMGSGCTAGDSRVYVMGEGFVPIRDLFSRFKDEGRVVHEFDGKGRYIDIGDTEVLTLALDEETGRYEFDKVELVWEYDVDADDKVTVRFDTGASATVSAWHPFLVWDGERIVERRADQLERGAAVMGPNETAVDQLSIEPIVVSYETSYHNSTERRHVLIDEDLAWLCGFFLGDGSLGLTNHRTTNKYGTTYTYRRPRLRFHDETTETLQRVIAIVERVFGETATIQQDGRGSNGKTITFTGRSVTGFFAELFPVGEKTYTIELPQFVWLAGRDIAFAFLAGLIDSDGSVNRGRAVYATASHEFAKDAAVLASFHRLGGGVRRDDSVSTATIVHRSTSAALRHDLGRHLTHPERRSRLLEYDTKHERMFCMPLSKQMSSEAFGEHAPADWLRVPIGDETFHLGRLRYEGLVNPTKLDRAVAVMDRQEPVLDLVSQVARSIAFVTSVEACTDDPDFYDLTVAHHSNYLAGETGLVAIHNTGSNFSHIRSEGEALAGGGKSSGLMSFLKIGDRAAGAIKSGGTTRRAAKMVILDIDHPDIEEFIAWKKVEEDKARILIEHGGFPADFNGEAYATVSGQNSNNSVRVTNEFIQAVIDDGDWQLTNRTDGTVRKTIKARDLWRQIADAAWACADPGMQYHTTINEWHTSPAGGEIRASNPCSEYMFLDNTACNLASLNLVRFIDADGTFDIEAYEHAIRLWTIVLEISVTMAHFPSREIAQGSYDYRTLGLGYANLGSLLMRWGIPYDSDEGRAIAGAITATLTGVAYAASAEMAAVRGPFPKFAENRDNMLRVMRNHRGAAYNESDFEGVHHHVTGIDPDRCPPDLLASARGAWDVALALGETHGYRNAQATVLAPTGCLVGGSLLATERGLVRLRSLGDPAGSQWQDLGVEVSTDEGPREATQFYVNGVEPVVTVETARGYRIQGTPTHRIKVVDTQTGEWQWRRFGDVRPDDLVPLQLNQLVGIPNTVTLPPLGEMHWTGDFTTTVPREMSAGLAELVGYFMGDGSLHAKGLRFCVAQEDFDVVERLTMLGKQLFNLEAQISDQTGYTEVAFHSVPLTVWWEACGFAKESPTENNVGKGYTPHIPDAVLHSNDPEIYQAFVRGLFEADGYAHSGGYASWSTTSTEFSHDVQSLLLALGYPTTRRMSTPGWGSSDVAELRLLNQAHSARWAAEIGFISGRKQAGLLGGPHPQTARKDHIPVTRDAIQRLTEVGDDLRNTMLNSLRRIGMVSRRSAEELFERTGDAELGQLLGFYYDRVAAAELGEEQYTYDLSVPDNVTYVANGFVSHNTIGLLMDCDTTGVEPDFALVKFKKLAGGGYFKIANQSIAPALHRLGYDDNQIADIIDYVIGTSTLLGAPHINRESLAEKGLTAEEIGKIEKALPSTFELKHAFNVFVVGEQALQRLGYTPDDYTSFDFDLLAALGFTKAQIAEANDYICGRQTIEGAPHLAEEHLAVFDCANRNGRYGERFIHHTGHIKMMAAAQPFISGAISKTINMPNEVTVDDVADAYRMSWELGIKAMALYRDGSKASQPLSASSDDGESEELSEEVSEALQEEAVLAWGKIPAGVSPTQAYASTPRPRFLLPARRGGFTQEARVGGHKVFLRTGEYEDGTLGEIFIDLAKEGATLRGVLASFAIAVSKGLQYGVPLEEFVDTFVFQTFEPRGMVEGHPNIKMANSIIDYMFRALGVEYLHRDELVQVPPDRSESDLPEPPKGIAAEAGQQLELGGAAKEADIDAQAEAAAFADGKSEASVSPPSGEGAARRSNGPGTMASQRERTAVAAAGSDYALTADLAAGELMGDAPACSNCGHMTVRNGSCYVCLTCGDTTGCS